MTPGIRVHHTTLSQSGLGGDALTPLEPLSAGRRALEALSALLDRLTRTAYLLATAGFTITLAASIIARYFLNSSIYWSTDVAVTLFVWATFLSIASGYRHRRHVAFSIIVAGISPTWSRRAGVIQSAMSLSFLVLLLLSAVETWPAVAAQQSVALHTSLLVPFTALPVATVLMLVHWSAAAAMMLSARRLALVLIIAVGFAYAVWLPAAAYIALPQYARYIAVLTVFLVSLLLGVPVAFALGLLGFAFVGTTLPLQFVSAADTVYAGVESINYLAIPLMILAGGLLFEMGLARNLVDFAQILTGRVRGGLAAADVVASAVFSDVSGSAVSDTAAIGRMVIPEMRRRGYDASFSAAVQASAGTLGLMVPPAITLIIYATTFSLSVTALFAAAIVPAAVVALGFIAVSTVISHRRGYPREPVPAREIAPRTIRALPALFGGVIVIGGILGGVFTPAEAGVVLVGYALALRLLAGPLRLKRLHGRDLMDAVTSAGHTSGMVLFLTATSTFVGFALARDFVPSRLVDQISQWTENRYVVLFAVNLLFILAGIVLEAPAIIVGLVPSVVPLLAAVGVDPINFAVIFVLNAAIGMMHPPIGLTFFVARDIADVSVGAMFREILPFLTIAAIILCVLCVWPQIALTLPHIFYGYNAE